MSADADSRPLTIVVAGHVDHGKSTFIGRLLHETGNLPDGKVEELVTSSRRRGVAMEWSFALDALQAERDQAITIDTSRVWFRIEGRRYSIVDAPGHRQFISNMLSGAAEADAAVLVVDVTEGVSEQTRRHAYLLRLLGLTAAIVAVNKMDAAGFDRERFAAVEAAIAGHVTGLGLTVAATIPISARDGENLVRRSDRMPWYSGPTVSEALAALRRPADAVDAALRLRVQDVYRAETKRIAVGQIESGTVRVGETVVISPLGATAQIASIERWPEPGAPFARTGESIGVTIDRPIYMERGDVISHVVDAPQRASSFVTTLFWLSESAPDLNARYRLKFGPTEVAVTIEAIEGIVDTETLASLAQAAPAQHAVFDLRLRSSALVPLDTRAEHPATARCVLLLGSVVVAGGFVARINAGTVAAANLHPHEHLVTRRERTERNGHRGAVIWLTGLSGSGKSTLAMAVERRLFARGMSVYVLDGDTVRSGLNRDLGFSAADRTENIRRVAEVAALFADAGSVVITAFISPFASDREAAKRAANGEFHEVFLSAGVASCERRDPKGLYARARRGELADFTGISAPYEIPVAPDLTIDTAELEPDACVELLLEYLDRVLIASLTENGKTADTIGNARVLSSRVPS